MSPATPFALSITDDQNAPYATAGETALITPLRPGGLYLYTDDHGKPCFIPSRKLFRVRELISRRKL